MKHLDLDLQIGRADNGYVLKVRSPGGEPPAVPFAPPFTDAELEAFWAHVDGRAPVDGRGEALTQEYGGRLFQHVFTGDALACLSTSLDRAGRRPGRGVRIRVGLTEAPELARLPWEYLYWKERRRYLAQDVRTPIVRYLDLADPPRALTVTLPLRVLVMISEPAGVDALQVEREWELVNRALTSARVRDAVVAHRVRGTLEDLRAALREQSYHVFHFIGHGGYDAATANGVLVFQDASGGPRPVTSAELGRLLWNEPAMRLVVINACEGARGSVRDPYAGVAQGLVQQGLPAVLAMQSTVPDEAAVRFSREFYAGIAAGQPVDDALTAARLAICGEGDRLEWGIPVLYMRTRAARLFRVRRRAVLRPVHAALVLAALITGLIGGLFLSPVTRGLPVRFDRDLARVYRDSLDQVIVKGNSAVEDLAERNRADRVGAYYMPPELIRVLDDDEELREQNRRRTHELENRRLDDVFVAADTSFAIAVISETWRQITVSAAGDTTEQTIPSRQIVELERARDSPGGWRMSHVRYHDLTDSP